MNHKIRKIAVTCSLAAIILIAGCETQTLTYENNSPVLFDRIFTQQAHISKASAYEMGDELIIAGKVKRNPYNCCEATRGHVDMAILTPDGDIVESIAALYSPRNIPKARTRSSKFSVKLPYKLPEGYTVRLTYHDSLENMGHPVYAENTFRCEHNKALPEAKSLL
ncbi:MAG: hypothetical protein FVQ80_05500 [Planctomycetes bacterium]|nr:hypothetical protein [Planctomycetota bacterium]